MYPGRPAAQRGRRGEREEGRGGGRERETQRREGEGEGRERRSKGATTSNRRQEIMEGK